MGGDHRKPARARTGSADSGQRTFLRAVGPSGQGDRTARDRHSLPRRLSDRPERRRTGAARRQEARDRRSLRRAHRHREQRHLRPASDPRGDRRRRPPGAVRRRHRRLACSGAVRDGCARRQRRGRRLAERTDVPARHEPGRNRRTRRRGCRGQFHAALLLGLGTAQGGFQLPEVLRHRAAKPSVRARGGARAARARRPARRYMRATPCSRARCRRRSNAGRRQARCPCTAACPRRVRRRSPP